MIGRVYFFRRTDMNRWPRGKVGMMFVSLSSNFLEAQVQQIQ